MYSGEWHVMGVIRRHIELELNDFSDRVDSRFLCRSVVGQEVDAWLTQWRYLWDTRHSIYRVAQKTFYLKYLLNRVLIRADSCGLFWFTGEKVASS